MASVVLKNRDGESISYSVAGVKLYNAGGELVPFGEQTLQDKTATPGAAPQLITADDGYDALNAVTVEAIPYAETSNPEGGKTATIG